MFLTCKVFAGTWSILLCWQILSVLSMMNTLCSLYSYALVHCYSIQSSKYAYPNHSPKISSRSGMSSSLVIVITWQVQAVWAGIRTQEMWLWLFMNTQMSIQNWIFKPNVIIQWDCGKIFFFFCCDILEGVICVWCRCMVVMHVVLCW